MVEKRVSQRMRWVRFSLVGMTGFVCQMVLTVALAKGTGLPVLVANLVAVAVMSVVNFWMHDRLVFRH
jgi:putative flippase GtrA